MVRTPRAVIEYGFRQRFRVPAPRAFRWAVDFTPGDWQLAGLSGRRSVARLAPSIVLLTDTTPSPSGGSVTKRRLVHLYPATRSWVSNHVGGPRLHSQFRYRIRAVGRGASELEFRGREVRWDRHYSAAELRRLARELRRIDARDWRQFARAMERDLLPRPR